jgi:hypothetical protein
MIAAIPRRTVLLSVLTAGAIRLLLGARVKRVAAMASVPDGSMPVERLLQHAGEFGGGVRGRPVLRQAGTREESHGGV